MTIAPAVGRRLHVVAACHRLQPGAFADRLQALAERCGFGLGGTVVCNNATYTCPTAGDFEFLRGSNELLDFSGFFEGLERLLSTRPEAAAGNVLFVNDTLFTKHPASCILGRVLGLDTLLRQLRVPAIGGKVAPFRSICRQNPWSGDRGFVPTFCYMLNARGLPIMQRLKSLADQDDVFTDAPISDQAWGRRMPPVLREHIRAHLAYEGSPYLWPAAGSTSADHLRKKAACVYLEARLSGAIGHEGALVPINSGPRSSTDIFVREFVARLARTTRAKAQ